MKIFTHLFLILTIPVGSLGNPLRGADALERLDLLPYLDYGSSAHQQSSFDRSGDNSDRNSWLYLDANDDYVIFDDVGPGCIYRFWMTHGGLHPAYSANYTTNHIKIYVDDDTVPRFECSIADFFSGTVAPFLSPLVGDKAVSSGGMYSYVPIPYETRCRIAFTDIPPVSMRDLPWGPDSYWMYYNVTYHKYASVDGMTSWTGLEDLSAVRTAWSETYVDPKSSTNTWLYTGNVALDAGASVELVSHSGTGVVNSIEFDAGNLTDEMMTNLWLEIYWDGDPVAAVEAPVGEFFGAGRSSSVTVGGQLMGRKPSGFFYSYFPMPFWGQARIVLENRSPTSAGLIDFSIGMDNRFYDPASSGRFHAHHAMQGFTNHVVEPDFVFLDETGRGQVVGTCLFGTGAGKFNGNGLAYLEGDERIYIDGSMIPQIHGTGTEDYFNGGWYYNNGAFSLPSHGSPVRSSPYGWGVETNYVGAYRLHIGDRIPFNQSILLGMEHGGTNQVGCTFSSVTYYYKLKDGMGGLIDCAQINVGMVAEEAVWSYQVDGGSVLVTNTYAYSGDEHDVLISDSGRAFSTGSSFQVDVPTDNAGVLLRRRIDAGTKYQSALVRVDGYPAGDWVFHDGGFTNVAQRWLDDEFYIAGGLTAGKSNLQISVEVSPGSDAWTEYRYSVYAILPFAETGDFDADGMTDTWEVEYFVNILNGVEDSDPDEDGFSNGDEFICLTDPIDKDSFFYLDGPTGASTAFSFDTHVSRIYRIMHSTNLLLEAWEEVYSSIGDGNPVVVLPVSIPSEYPSFYKVSVEKE